MPKFRVFLEETSTNVRAKVFDAETMEDAQEMATAEGDVFFNNTDGWEGVSGATSVEIREDLCEELERPILSVNEALTNLLDAYGGDVPDWLVNEYDDARKALKAAGGTQ